MLLCFCRTGVLGLNEGNAPPSRPTFVSGVPLCTRVPRLLSSFESSRACRATRFALAAPLRASDNLGVLERADVRVDYPACPGSRALQRRITVVERARHNWFFFVALPRVALGPQKGGYTYTYQLHALQRKGRPGEQVCTRDAWVGRVSVDVRGRCSGRPPRTVLNHVAVEITFVVGRNRSSLWLATGLPWARGEGCRWNYW